MIMEIYILLLKVSPHSGNNNRNLNFPFLSFEMGSAWPGAHCMYHQAGFQLGGLLSAMVNGMYDHPLLNDTSFRKHFPTKPLLCEAV